MKRKIFSVLSGFLMLFCFVNQAVAAEGSYDKLLREAREKEIKKKAEKIKRLSRFGMTAPNPILISKNKNPALKKKRNHKLKSLKRQHLNDAFIQVLPKRKFPRPQRRKR